MQVPHLLLDEIKIKLKLPHQIPTKISKALLAVSVVIMEQE